MSVNVTDMLKDFIRTLLNDRDTAAQFVSDPHGVLAEQGLTDQDLSGVDVPKAVGEVCADPSVSQGTRSALQSYSGGSAGPHTSGPQSVEQVVQHLNYVTYATYEGDDYITNQITNVSGTVFGDVDVNNDNDINVASGDGAQVIDGDNFGQANTGDGAVQAGHDINGPVNTGTNTGIVGNDNDHNVIGDHNQTANVEGSADQSVINFGGGDVNNLPNADIDDSAVSFGDGDASNASHNTLDHGSAIATGEGHASGSNVEDNSVTTIVDDHSVVDDHHVDDHHQDVHQDVHQSVHNDSIVSGDDTNIGAHH